MRFSHFTHCLFCFLPSLSSPSLPSLSLLLSLSLLSSLFFLSGIFGGAVALAALMVFSRKKEGNMSQKVMQARVAVQALVVAGLGGGAIYANMSRKTTSDIHDK